MPRMVESWVIAAAVGSAALLSGSDALAQDAAARRAQFRIVDIGALPGADEQPFRGSNALGVNNRGEVVGGGRVVMGSFALQRRSAAGGEPMLYLRCDAHAEHPC